jgi:hypothetical protein
LGYWLLSELRTRFARPQKPTLADASVLSPGTMVVDFLAVSISGVAAAGAGGMTGGSLQVASGLYI